MLSPYHYYEGKPSFGIVPSSLAVKRSPANAAGWRWKLAEQCGWPLGAPVTNIGFLNGHRIMWAPPMFRMGNWSAWPLRPMDLRSEGYAYQSAPQPHPENGRRVTRLFICRHLAVERAPSYYFQQTLWISDDAASEKMPPLTPSPRALRFQETSF